MHPASHGTSYVDYANNNVFLQQVQYSQFNDCEHSLVLIQISVLVGHLRQ